MGLKTRKLLVTAKIGVGEIAHPGKEGPDNSIYQGPSRVPSVQGGRSAAEQACSQERALALAWLKWEESQRLSEQRRDTGSQVPVLGGQSEGWGRG